MTRYSNIVRNTLLTTVTAASVLFTACADNMDHFGETEEKVIGGQVERQAPDYVGVLTAFVSDTQVMSLCTVSLIDNDSVLTAAHCLEGLEAEVEAGIIGVCLGDSKWIDRGNYCPSGNFATVVAFENHPDYDSNLLVNDVSVAKLGNSFPNLEKARLASRNRHTSGNTTSYGYGLKKTPVDLISEDTRTNQGKIDSKLRSLGSKTINTNQCNDLIDDLNVNHPPVSGKHICIEVSSDSNLCEGDSGGPTFINGKLVGVTSRGTFNAQFNKDRYKKCDGSGPTVLMNVKAYRSWILSSARRF